MVVLPIWFDWLWAPGIFLALPALGLLDFLALGGILAAMHVENPWKRSRRVFFQVWICGFFCRSGRGGVPFGAQRLLACERHALV